MVALVRAFAAVLPGQFHAAAFHSVDGADVNAVRPDDLHVLPDRARIHHVPSPACTLSTAIWIDRCSILGTVWGTRDIPCPAMTTRVRQSPRWWFSSGGELNIRPLGLSNAPCTRDRQSS